MFNTLRRAIDEGERAKRRRGRRRLSELIVRWKRGWEKGWVGGGEGWGGRGVRGWGWVGGGSLEHNEPVCNTPTPGVPSLSFNNGQNL